MSGRSTDCVSQSATKRPAAIPHRGEHIALLRLLPENHRNRLLDARIADHPGLTVFGPPRVPAREGLALNIDLAARGIAPQQMLQLPPP